MATQKLEKPVLEKPSDTVVSTGIKSVASDATEAQKVAAQLVKEKKQKVKPEVAKKPKQKAKKKAEAVKKAAAIEHAKKEVARLTARMGRTAKIIESRKKYIAKLQKTIAKWEALNKIDIALLEAAKKASA